MSEEIIFDDEIRVNPRSWEWIEFEAESGDALHIVARENDRYDFDLYIVPAEDVNKDDYYIRHALFTKEFETYYRGEYKFRNGGSFSFLISNYRAQSVPRDLYLKLTLVTPDKKEVRIEEKEKKKRDKQVQKARKKEPIEVNQYSHEKMEASLDSRGFSWKGACILTLVLSALGLISFLISTVSTFLGGALLTIGGILLAIFRNDIREMLGLD